MMWLSRYKHLLTPTHLLPPSSPHSPLPLLLHSSPPRSFTQPNNTHPTSLLSFPSERNSIGHRLTHPTNHSLPSSLSPSLPPFPPPSLHPFLPSLLPLSIPSSLPASLSSSLPNLLTQAPTPVHFLPHSLHPFLPNSPTHPLGSPSPPLPSPPLPADPPSPNLPIPPSLAQFLVLHFNSLQLLRRVHS